MKVSLSVNKPYFHAILSIALGSSSCKLVQCVMISA